VAVRVTSSQNPQENGLFYTLGDQLGSTTFVADSSGNKVGEMRYMPWGETRYTGSNIQTSYHYTGQREDEGIGLYYYNARWYDAGLGRFAQADNMISGSPKSLDLYAYVYNSPMENIDPTGNTPMCFYRECFNLPPHPCNDDPPNPKRMIDMGCGSPTGRGGKGQGGNYFWPSQLKTDDAGRAFIIYEEGSLQTNAHPHDNPYFDYPMYFFDDQRNVCTFGYGHAVYMDLGEGPQKERTCIWYIQTLFEGSKLDFTLYIHDTYCSPYYYYDMECVNKVLSHDIEVAEATVRSLVSIRLTQSMFNALVSFTFQMGPAGLLDLLQRGGNSYIGIRDALLSSPGYGSRREDEARLFAGEGLSGP
jgi:RHS repeat-associated protein